MAASSGGYLRTILARWFGRKATDFTDLVDTTLQSTAGVSVSETTAYRLTAVWACVRVISEDVASLPIFVYERLDRGKRKALTHPLYDLLHNQPNPEMTALQFREALTAHALTWGNGYAYKVVDSRGVVRELWPLLPDRTWPRRDPQTRELFYETEAPTSDQRFRLRADQVMHLAGLGFDGLVGYSPIALHRQTIGLGLAAEEFGARFFSQGTNMGGFISHPGSLSQQAYDRLMKDPNLGLPSYQGIGRAHLWRILEEGMKPERMGIPPDEAQFIETRKFTIAEIARIFRVPPHKIQDLERATFSNIEEQAIDYVVSTLRPWLVRWEQAIRMKLLSADHQRTHFVEHVVDGLLRGNTQTRYAAYSTGRQWGWLSANDIRELENLNPIEDGDRYLEPANMRTPEQADASMDAQLQQLRQPTQPPQNGQGDVTVLKGDAARV